MKSWYEQCCHHPHIFVVHYKNPHWDNELRTQQSFYTMREKSPGLPKIPTLLSLYRPLKYLNLSGLFIHFAYKSLCLSQSHTHARELCFQTQRIATCGSTITTPVSQSFRFLSTIKMLMNDRSQKQSISDDIELEYLV